MSLFVEGAVPQLMGMNLLAHVNNYQAQQAFQPRIVHEFDKTRGKFVQIDRFNPWGEQGLTMSARARDKTEIIGTANSEGLSKTSRTVMLQEFTGPSTKDGRPSTLHVTYEDMIYARNRLMDYGILAFHESIGSANLADDFARWYDRALIERGLQATYKHNPGSKPDNLALSNDRIRLTDVLKIKEELSTNNTKRFPDGTYHVLISERMFRHLNEDPDFRDYARAIIQGGGYGPLGNMYPTYGPSGQPMAASGLGPRMIAQPLLPVVYEGMTFYPTNNLPVRLIQTNNGPLLAFLGLFFGPDTIGIGSGGRGPEVKLNSQTDFERHFHFIWRWFGQFTYLLDDNEFSGICIEARTFDT